MTQHTTPAGDAQREALDTRRLHDKFRIERTDGRGAPGQKHHDCRYFVLDLDHDEDAAVAIAAYADAARDTRPELAADLDRAWPTTRRPSAPTVTTEQVRRLEIALADGIDTQGYHSAADTRRLALDTLAALGIDVTP